MTERDIDIKYNSPPTSNSIGTLFSDYSKRLELEMIGTVKPIILSKDLDFLSQDMESAVCGFCFDRETEFYAMKIDSIQIKYMTTLAAGFKAVGNEFRANRYLTLAHKLQEMIK